MVRQRREENKDGAKDGTVNVDARAFVAQAHLAQNAAPGRPRARAESRAKENHNSMKECRFN